MLRFALSFAILAATIGIAQAEPRSHEETNSGTSSYLQQELRACNHLDTAAARDACKASAWQEHTYAVPKERVDRSN